jgi:hypothetical protein
MEKDCITKQLNNMKTFIIIFILTIIISGSIFLHSCCNCDETLIKPAEPACNVKNNALIEFKPGIKDTTVTGSDGKDSTYFKPLPGFATETFEFPANNSSSGSQPSDERFSSSAFPVVSEVYKSLIIGSDVTAVIYDNYPPNDEILGDIMVTSVTIDSDPLRSTAKLRFYGTITRYSKDFPSENSGDFCEKFIPENTDIGTLRDNSSHYGEALKDDGGTSLASQVTKGSYVEGDITVIDKDGKQVTDAIPDDVKARLLDKANAKGLMDITVTPGQVYYVKARNGREFAIHITGISQGVFPNDPVKKKRVFIMFAPIN